MVIVIALDQDYRRGGLGEIERRKAMSLHGRGVKEEDGEEGKGEVNAEGQFQDQLLRYYLVF